MCAERCFQTQRLRRKRITAVPQNLRRRARQERLPLPPALTGGSFASLFPCTFPATTEPQAASDPFSARGGQHDSGPFVVQQNSSTAHVVPRSAHARLLRLASASSSRRFSPRLPSAPPFGIPRNRALLCCAFSPKRPSFTTRHDRGPLSSPPPPRSPLRSPDR